MKKNDMEINKEEEFLTNEVRDDSNVSDYGIGMLRNQGVDILYNITDVEVLRSVVASLNRVYSNLVNKRMNSISEVSEEELFSAMNHVKSLSLHGDQRVPKDVSGIECLIEDKYLEK